MTFWQIFLHVLPKRPKDALAALYWHLTQRRLRAWNLLRAISAPLPIGYDLWISTVERAPDLVRDAAEAMRTWSLQPSFLVLVYPHVGSTDERIRHSKRSVERQVYPNWTLLAGTECSLESEGVAGADFVIPLRAGDELPETALFRYAEALQANRTSAILFGDQDEFDSHGRRSRPWFKPDWNPEMFLALDFLSRAVAIESKVAIRTGVLTGSLSSDRLSAALLKATAEAEGPITHVPHILCHVDATSGEVAPATRVDLVSDHLESRSATCEPGPFGTTRVRWPLPDSPPKVSIIIPTKDKVELLRACIDSVLRRTSYPCFEIVVVDNASVDPETIAYLDEIVAQPSVRVLSYNEPYNFSAINNFAVRHAEGTFLCLLNNDTEVIEPDWLTEMMRYAVRPEVGAVGAQLQYGDGTIQHAGIVLGMGDAAGHAHRFTPADQPGYFRQPHVAQFVSAVTAACLVVERQKFQAVGGFDEASFAIAYNDVDLCLRLLAVGWKNVYVPHATLLHHETKSRDSDFSPTQHERYLGELRVLQHRWQTKTVQDPLHNPNLDRYSETFLIRL